MFDFATRWCARRCIEPRHPPNDVASTTRWRESGDPELGADNRAWHSGLAAAEPDESVAADLERCAGRAQDRGGLAAAAAFLDRATALTPDPTLQAGRALAAAEASFQAGEFEATQRLLATAQSGALDGFQQARAALLVGHAAAVSRYGNEAATLLLAAAQRLEPFDLSLARRAYLTAWSAAVTAHHLGGADILVEVSRAVRALPPLPPDPHPLDLMIEAFALLITDGHVAAMPVLRRAADEVMRLAVEDVVRWGWHVGGVRTAMWHDEAITVYERQAQLVREAGALAELPIHLQALALERAWRGDLPGAERLVAEAESISAINGQRGPAVCPAPHPGSSGTGRRGHAVDRRGHPGGDETRAGHRGDDGLLGGCGAEQRSRAVRAGSGGGPGSRE